MKTVAAIVAVVAVAALAEAGYVAPYAGLAAAHHSGAYYDDHHYAGALGYAASYAAPYAAYHHNPSGTYSYWGSHGPTVVQENAASLAHPLAHGEHLYSPYAAPYGLYGAAKATVVQANVAANPWGYPSAYGAYGHGYGYGYDKYLTAVPATKYLL
ncbi:homeotic protein deformed-like [Anopheles bellator]|uniref:homeotic protein deformed-like n=1 Tax=Anopheles bellator TaxID=139047 RepID=UPI0026487EFF|nr:homeotic protein deformed-like [Anopheles bellator]